MKVCLGLASIVLASSAAFAQQATRARSRRNYTRRRFRSAVRDDG